MRSGLGTSNVKFVASKDADRELSCCAERVPQPIQMPLDVANKRQITISPTAACIPIASKAVTREYCTCLSTTYVDKGARYREVE